MEILEEVLKEALDKDLEQIVVSAPRSGSGNGRGGEGVIRKVCIRPLLLKGALCFQAERFTERQVFHANLDAKEAAEYLTEPLQSFKQMQIYRQGEIISILSGKKGTVRIRRKKLQDGEPVDRKEDRLLHDRKKKSILPEDVPVPFLVDLGVQGKAGGIVKGKYDKFRQINRFLEFIRDVLPKLPKDRTVRILDFGCGKSYLTFAMYYYLRIMNGLDVDITGLDLKEDVIERCNRLKETYGYDGLRFMVGDISRYEQEKPVDMVVTLHACDTATDYALAKAVKWNAGVILSVPCCQHELNRQISCDLLSPVLKYGLLKERTAALFTDAVRAALLEREGYDVQVLEFIDMEHTPKNILLRCVREERMRPRQNDGLEAFLAALSAKPTLAELLKGEHGA